MLGRVDVVKAGFRRAGIDEHLLEIRVPHSAEEAAPYIEALYKRVQRRGALHRDAVRMVTNDRNIYAASMLKADDADARSDNHKAYWTSCSCYRLGQKAWAGNRLKPRATRRGCSDPFPSFFRRGPGSCNGDR